MGSAAVSVKTEGYMYTVVCFGDTNTWGYDNRSGERLPYGERWTGILAHELGDDFRIIEEGQPGRATTEDPVEPGKNAKKYIGPCLESHEPVDVFVMMLGQPDLKKRFSLTACDISMGIEVLAKIVLTSNAGPEHRPPKLLIISPVQVGVVAGSPMENWFPSVGTSERSAQLPALYKRIADKYGAEFLEASTVAATAEDAIHIDNSSHKAFACAVAEKIRKLLEI